MGSEGGWVLVFRLSGTTTEQSKIPKIQERRNNKRGMQIRAWVYSLVFMQIYRCIAHILHHQFSAPAFRAAIDL